MAFWCSTVHKIILEIQKIYRWCQLAHTCVNQSKLFKIIPRDENGKQVEFGFVYVGTKTWMVFQWNIQHGKNQSHWVACLLVVFKGFTLKASMIKFVHINGEIITKEENHISFVQEPDSLFIGHKMVSNGCARAAVTAKGEPGFPHWQIKFESNVFSN